MHRIVSSFVLVSFLYLMVLSATGCAWLPGKKDKYGGTSTKITERQVMKVPGHLTTPEFEDLYPVPDVEKAFSSTAPDEKLELKPPSPIEIIWGDQKILLEENKASAWLTVKAPVNEVWELLLTFWAREHIDLATPQKMGNGVMITRWFNQAVFDDNPKKYEKVRLEINEGQNKYFSNIALTFISKKAKGLESLESVEVDWAKQSSRSSKKKTLPYLLTLKNALINGMEEQKTVSLLEQNAELAPLVQIKKVDDTAVLYVKHDFNLAWAAVEDAVGMAELLVADVDRSKGRIFLQLYSNGTKSKLLKRLEKQRLLGMSNEIETLILHLTEQDGMVVVSVEDDQGQKVAFPIADFVLRLLIDQIGKSR